jgi:two-component system sensor histidine kinase/response regulator
MIRVKTHLTLQRQRKQLELSNAFEKKIFSIIGHDLRSPMGNIRTYIEAFLQVNPNLGDLVTGLLKDLYLLSDNAFNLLENLLNWAKSKSGGIVCRPQSGKANYIIQSAISLFHLQAENKKINLRYEENGQDIGYFDPELISVVVRNLVSNALKFTPHDGSVLIRNFHKEDQGVLRLMIQVTDTGTGMSPEVIDQLMNRNFHFTTYGTDNEKGSGLGFQLCKEFVHMNAGSISISSVPGSGSTFTISLPAGKPAIQVA